MVAELLKGKSAEEAGALLNFTVKKAAKPILKLLNSAIANAKNNFQLDPNNLYVSKITVDEGPKIKRWMPRARGSASEIQKKISHIYLVLDEIDKSKKAVVAERGPLTPGVRATLKEKPKPKPVAEVKKPVVSRVAKKIFRRQVF